MRSIRTFRNTSWILFALIAVAFSIFGCVAIANYIIDARLRAREVDASNQKIKTSIPVHKPQPN